MCICSLRYPACKAHASIVILTLSSCTIFCHVIYAARVSLEKTFFEHEMWFDILYNFCMKLLILYEVFSEIVINVQKPLCKVTFILVR